MFCGHCGKPNPDTNTVCASCGKEMKLALNMAPAAAAAAPAPAREQAGLPGLENYSGPQGVGGWLLLFCLGTTILTPLMLLREAMNNSGDLTVVSIDLGLAALAISTGIALWSRSRYALPLARAYFIAQLVLAAMIIIGNAVRTPANAAGGGTSGRFVFEGIRIIAVVALWWTYFKKSDRVHATYGRNL